MPAKTVQLLAIAGTVKDETATRIAQLQNAAAQQGLFDGHDRSYQPAKDGGVQLPAESKAVRATAREVLELAEQVLTRHWDLALTLDHANAAAKADVSCGDLVLKDVPVGHLLWLHKEVDRLAKLVAALPELDPARSWSPDGMPAGQVKAEPVQTTKNEKVPGAFVLYEATKEHPAQVQRLDRDEVVGYWTQVNFSGAIHPKRKQELLARLTQLSEALRMAREGANTAAVTDHKEAAQVFAWLWR